MISQGFKDRVKNSLYNYYKIQCNKFITVSDTSYYINAKDQRGRDLFITLYISNTINGYSVSPQFTVSIDGLDVINNKLFMLDKIQSALDKSVDILKEIKSTHITSLTLKSSVDDYVLLMGGCSQGSSYLNPTYTIPYSPQNGFILWANDRLYKIAEILDRNHQTVFKPIEQQNSLTSDEYLTQFNFHLKDDEQKLLDDYILKTIISYDISLHSYALKDSDALNFLNSLKYDLITYDDISYVKDFYTVINMIKV